MSYDDGIKKFTGYAPWIVSPDEVEPISNILAKFAARLDPHLDESEMFDMIYEWLDQTDINTINVVDLVTMLKTTAYNPKHDTLH